LLRGCGGRVVGSAVGRLGNASKQRVERLDVVVVDGAAMPAAHLLTAVAVVGRARVVVAASQQAASPAVEPGVAAEQSGEHVVEVDVADDEQRPVPRLAARSTLQPRALTLYTFARPHCVQLRTSADDVTPAV